MAGNLNRVLLMGNLTRDPELRYLPSNMPVVGVGLAINRRWRNQQGEQQDETTFVDCEAFGRTAEVINQYLRKGRPIFIEGRLKLDQWQNKEGQNRSKLKVIIENFQFIDSRSPDDNNPGHAGGPQAGSGYGQSNQAYSRPSGYSAPPGAGSGGGASGDFGGESGGSGGSSVGGDPHQPVAEDDIPF